jgi:cytochrome c
MMRIKLLVALAVTSALAAVACATPPAQTQADAASTADGRRLAEIHCARCHEIGAAGESPHPLAPPLRTLSRNYEVTALEEAFAEGVLVGHRDMPEFRFEPAQIEALVAYIESIQERRGG